ncbi:MAG: hypothetical protein DBX40_00925 [Clostridiales bacterium]|nr:MAG: hypothetical protein DBX40_00925 [Clostridiales bacterium]
MPTPSAIEVCRADLFTRESELLERYPQVLVDKVLRVREMYNWFISNPDGSDREFVAEVMQRHDISKVTAYSDLAIVKALLPMMSTASRDFHRWRTNEMLIATYKMAEKRKDSKTMERAATAYGKLNRIDLEDEQAMPYDKIVPQPFTATDDPRVLGIEPIPNINEKISQMIEKYRRETIDIEDVEVEEYDLEFDTLFPDKKQETDPDNGREESLL